MLCEEDEGEDDECKAKADFFFFFYDTRANAWLTRERLPSLQDLLDVRHHDPLHVLQLSVDAAQVPSGSAVDVQLLGFLNVGVWGSGINEQIPAVLPSQT